MDLPEEYDVVVLGTGMTESIVAAALSRAGMAVLHLDRYDYYSGDWACFHFKGFQDWIKAKQDPSESEHLHIKSLPENLLTDGETAVNLAVNSSSVKNVKQKVYIREEMEKVETAPQDPATSDSAKQNVDEIKVTSVSLENAGTVKTTDDTVITTGNGISEEQKSCSEIDNADIGRSDMKRSEDTAETTGDAKPSTSNEITGQQEIPSETVNQEICRTNKKGDCNEITKEQTVSQEPEDVKACVGDNKGDYKTSDNGLEKEEEQGAQEDDLNGQRKKKTWSFSQVKEMWRKFNIDLMPKVLFCRGPMVELLISSDVAKYCEFRTVSRVLTLLNGKLEQVPCSRSDVFGSKLVSMIEKRMMMKFLTFCLEYEKHEENYIDFKEKPYREYLQSQKLSSNIQHFVQHSIAMVTDETSTLEGLKCTQTFLQSLGRYGNTAFLWPLYGSGELPQCFCRMCAVFGGVYCLRRTVQTMLVNCENKCHAVVDTEGQKLQTKWLIMEAGFADESLLSSPINSYTSRAILLTDKSLNNCESQDLVTMLSLPVQGLSSPVSLLELPASANCCPEGFYLVHLTCVCKDGAEQDFKPVIEDLFDKADKENATPSDSLKPCILWATYFEVADTTKCSKRPDVPSNVYLVGGPNHCLDFGYSVSTAKSIFSEICPDQEFLPKAPNPEDIIWDDGDQTPSTGEGFAEPSAETTRKEEVNGDISEDKQHSGVSTKDGGETTTVQDPETSETQEASSDSNTDKQSGEEKASDIENQQRLAEEEKASDIENQQRPDNIETSPDKSEDKQSSGVVVEEEEKC